MFRVVGETAGAGASLGPGCAGVAPQPLLAQRQAGPWLPALQVSWSVARIRGQQRDIMGQVWDTESPCWRQECLPVVLDGISQVFAGPLGWP